MLRLVTWEESVFGPLGVWGWECCREWGRLGGCLKHGNVQLVHSVGIGNVAGRGMLSVRGAAALQLGFTVLGWGANVQGFAVPCTGTGLSILE